MDTATLKSLTELGYEEIHEINGIHRGIMEFMFTWAICDEIGAYGYERRWCYPNRQEAIDALIAWNKSNDEEPDHWIRRTHIKDDYPIGFDHTKGHRMSDVVHGRLVL